MKTLKFESHLAKKILSGEKTCTWRLYDEKNLQRGDSLSLVNKDTLESFGTGLITNLKVKSLGALIDEDWEGHEKFSSEEEMYQTYRRYYGLEVDAETEVKIINFTFEAL